MNFDFLWNKDNKGDEAFIEQFIQDLDSGETQKAYWAFYGRFSERMCKKIISRNMKSEYITQIPRIFLEGLKEVIEKDYPQNKIDNKKAIYSYIQTVIRRDYIDYIRKEESIKRKEGKLEKKLNKKVQLYTPEMYADYWSLALVDLKPVCKELIKKVKVSIKIEEGDSVKLQPFNGELKNLTAQIVSLKEKEASSANLVKTFDKYKMHSKEVDPTSKFDIAYNWVRQTFRRCGENFIDEFTRILKAKEIK